MFCTNCGLELPDDARFCSRCGALIDSNDGPESNIATLGTSDTAPSVGTMGEHVSAATDKSRKRIPLVLLVVLVALAVATAAFAAWAVWTYVIAPVPIEQPVAEVVVDEGEVEQGADEESTPEPVPSVAYEVVNGAPDGSTLREDWPFSYATFTGADGGEAAAERMNAVIMDDVSAAWEEYQQYAAMAEEMGDILPEDRSAGASLETHVTYAADGYVSLAEALSSDTGGAASGIGTLVTCRTFDVSNGDEVSPGDVFGLTDGELHDATVAAMMAYAQQHSAEMDGTEASLETMEAILARTDNGGAIDKTAYSLTPDGLVLHLDARFGGYAPEPRLFAFFTYRGPVFVAPWPGVESSYQPGDDYSDAMASIPETGKVAASTQ